LWYTTKVYKAFNLRLVSISKQICIWLFSLISSKREVVGFETKLHLPHTHNQTSIYHWEQASV
jgi:hypothetical protein